jgi:cell wall-associated NlpC family hydrolase
VRTAVETARAAPRRSASPIALLPWQARVRIVRREGCWTLVLLAGGEPAYLPAAALAEGCAPGGRATPSRIVRTARLWLGSPYLWGGRTPAGFDCSGLVQAVWAWHGVSLPRDAGQQRESLATVGRRRQRAASAEAGSEAKPGDLLFFGPAMETVTHVGIALGSCEFIHSYGTVRLGSLRRDSQLFVSTLVEKVLGAWPVRPARAGAGSADPYGS